MLSAGFVCISIFAVDTDEYSRFYDKDYVVKLNAGVEYNQWFPDESFLLNYKTTGLTLLKGDIQITHSFKFLPEINLNYETNLGGKDTDDILLEQQKNDGLRAVYNKIKLIAGWGNRIENFAERFGYYNPWRSNSNVEFYFSRETFRISVTPVYNMYYCDYDGNVSFLSSDDTLTMYTKFDELQLDFNTKGKLIIPLLFNALFSNPYAMTDVINSSLDTQLGGYYTMWQKPYSVTQILTGGEVSGYDNLIYAAKFNAAGLVENITHAGKIFYFHSQCNMGIAWVNLSNGQNLSDSSSPLFMHFKLDETAGFHIPMFSDRVNLNLYGNFNWGFMVGVAPDSSGNSALTVTSFINSDLLIKGTASFTLLI